MIKISKQYRSSETFLRNSYEVVGPWNMPLIKKENIDLANLELMSIADIKKGDAIFNWNKGIHSFVDDYRFENLYEHPEKYYLTLSQYRFLLTPDFSLYRELPRPLQIANVFKNRWCGADWQAHGLSTIATISWSDHQSYQFCFDGVEEQSIVAIGMIGCKRGNKRSFLSGYSEMLKRIKPSAIIVYGDPFSEMTGNIIHIPYQHGRRAN